MTLTADALTTHELAAEAALGRLQRRWARSGVGCSAEAEVVAALLPILTRATMADTADVTLPPAPIVASAISDFGARLANAVTSRLRVRAAAIVSTLTGKRASLSAMASAEVGSARWAGAQAVAAEAMNRGAESTLTWRTSGSCTHSACLSLEGMSVPYGSTFPGAGDGPPLHPHCRCRAEVRISLGTAITSESLAAAGGVPEAPPAPSEGWQAVVAIAGEETPDHRLIESASSLKWRTLPLPLTWSPNSDDHEMDVVVGSITDLVWQGDELRATGTWDTSATATEAHRLVDAQVLRFVSMVHDEPRAWEVRQSPDGCGEAMMLDPTGATDCTLTYVVQDADVAKLTLVDHPAFPGSVIVPLGATIPARTPQGRPAAMLVACGALAELPESDWFGNPHLTEPTPLTVTADGRVFGHFAADVPHVGGAGRPPRGGEADYSGFHLFPQECADGSTVRVGLIVCGTGHPNDAPRPLSVTEAQQFYAGGPGAFAAARIRVGEDAHGLWFSGVVDPSLDADQRAQLRLFGVSGDWRRATAFGPWSLTAVVGGVLVPGYPVKVEPPSLRLVASGTLTSLVTTSPLT